MAVAACIAIVAGVAENLVMDYLVRPVIRNLSYAFCFGNIVQDFREQAGQLGPACNRLQHQVEEARRLTRQIEPDVQNRLAEFAYRQMEVNGLEIKIAKSRRCFRLCPNGCCRWSLSKKVAKTTLSIKNLLGRPGFAEVGYRVFDSGPESSSNDFITFESRKSAFQQILLALRDDDVNMIGLHGMGGAGKTTLVEEVQREAKNLQLFDHVVMALVSQKPRTRNIQSQIADRLGLEFSEETTEGRAHRLKIRLSNGDRVLIILDDVWTRLNLGEIGIPHGQTKNGCKILFTTRRQHLCSNVGGEREIKLEVLEEKEAWKLFEMNADLNNPSREILQVATDIAKRCKGLPIALVTLGKALRGKSLNGWKAAFLNLQRCRLVDIEGAIEGEKDAYTCLVFSYTYLRNPKTKQCFLLCASFPENEIDEEDLVRCAWGLELYGDVTLDEARTYVLSAIEDLRGSSLLLDSGERDIKMHDMFRDVGLFIRDCLQQASQEGSSSTTSGVGTLEWLRNEIGLKPYRVFSLTGNENETTIDLDRSIQESLEALLIFNVHVVSSLAVLNSTRDLKVLTIAGGSLKVDYNQFRLLKNLRTLNLVFCGFEEFSSLIGMEKLEILTIHDTDMEELPYVIGELKSLRLLDLSECGSLQRIPPLLLQELSRLEELYIGGFKKWATSPAQSNARLSELDHLTRLSALSLTVAPTSLPNDFVFPKLGKYEIVVDESRNSSYPTTRSLQVKKVESLNAFKNLLSKVQHLQLDGIGGVENLVPGLDQDGLIELTSLALESCQDVKYLVESVNTVQPQHNQQLINFSCLSALTSLKIANCSKLKHIFPVSQAKDLPPLRVLHLKNLPNIKGVLDQQRSNVVIKLPSLEELQVTDCPQLSAFVVSAGIQAPGPVRRDALTFQVTAGNDISWQRK